MQKKKNYYYNNQNNSDYPYGYSSSNNYNYPEYMDENQRENNIYNNPFQKYLMPNNPKTRGYLDLNSSQEEINSKEDIIETKSGDEIALPERGKFRFVNNQIGQDDKIETNNYSTQTNNFKNSNNNNSNKITNNICIIINKPDKDENNDKNMGIDYLNNYGKNNDDYNNNIRKSPLIENKNINQYILNYKQNTQMEPKHENQKNYNYPYMDKEPNEKGKKMTLHKKLKQQEQKLRDLEQKIQNKELSIKKSKANLKEKENERNTSYNAYNTYNSYNRREKSYKDKNNLKENSVTFGPSLNKSKSKKRAPNLKNNINFQHESINSEDKIFHDIPMIKIQKNKYYEEDENLNRTMLSNTSRDNSVSFNKSIEQKRKILGIPMYKNEYKKYNKSTKDTKEILSKEDKKNLNKLEVFKKRQNEILRDYEKKKIMSQISRENIRNNNKNKIKTPIRIIYNDNYNFALKTSSYFYKNNENRKKDFEERLRKMNLNNSYVLKRPLIMNQNRGNSRSQRDIDNHPRKNKTNIYNKDESRNYIKKKIKIYKQKEKPKPHRRIIPKEIDRKSKDSIEFNSLPANSVVLKDKKIYENNSYYSQLMSKLFKEPKKAITNNKQNRTLNSSNNNKSTYYNSNSYYNARKNKNLNLSNINDVTHYKAKIIFSSPKNNEVMTIQNNEDGKTLRIVKKRRRSPKKISVILQKIQRYKNINQKNNTNNSRLSETKRPIKEKKSKLGKKEYLNTAPTVSRGISALRRINQKIENYKKRIPSKKKRKNKNQTKSLSQLKKDGKHPIGKVKPNNSIRTLPDTSKGKYFPNFDLLDDL